jgi:hypothetical protein
MPEHTLEERPIVNQLREEYFDLLPEIRRAAFQLEAEIRYHTLSTLHRLKDYEQLIIRPRVKECESAVQALRRRQEGGIFDQEKQRDYSLLVLPDLAGVRVLVFPRSRVVEVDGALLSHFKGWTSDPVLDDRGAVLAYKYTGRCRNVVREIRAEYQVVPMLIGLYWQVEHSAIYKPAPASKAPKDRANSGPMENLDARVVRALLDFEAEFERLKAEQAEPPSRLS